MVADAQNQNCKQPEKKAREKARRKLHYSATVCCTSEQVHNRYTMQILVC
jgi:hypothetical protein